jgi:hypothetical protein
MRLLPVLGRAVTALGLVVAAVGLGTAGARADGLARACRHPEVVTSGWEGHGLGRYYADSDMWNAAGYDVTQTMRVCSHGNWSVDVKADDRAGDGAVKTYPNVHRDYHDWGTGHEPRLSSFRSIASTFASRSPGVGVSDGAYDIWLNGVADDGSTELMIWTDNHHQTPAGKVVARHLRFSHRTWKLWATRDHGYLAFVPDRPHHHGRIALKKRFSYLDAHGYLAHGSTLGQVCFGYEMVSTEGTTRHFKVDRFSVSSSRK